MSGDRMDGNQLDQSARRLTAPGSRRGLLARLSALPLGVALAALLGEEEGEAGRRKRRKARYQRRKARHQRRKHRRQRNRKDNTKGRGRNKKGKSTGPPNCTETTDCPEGQVCVDGACAACDVCPGCAGDSARAAINAAKPGDRIVICPERYGENLTIDNDQTLSAAEVPSARTSPR